MRLYFFLAAVLPVAALWRLALLACCSVCTYKATTPPGLRPSPALYSFMECQGACSPQLERCASTALFTIGDVSLLRAAKLPSGLVVLLQALTSPQLLAQAPRGEAAAAAAPAEQGAGGAGNSAAGGASEAVGTRREVPLGLQAHAWIALGKACLMDEPLAKKVVPLFVQVGAWIGGD